MSEISFHDLSSASAEQRASLLKRAEADLSVFVEKVRPILEAVRTEGDAALLRFVRDLDKADVAAGSLKVSEAEFDAAFGKVDKDVIDSIRFGITNIRHFHEEQRPETMWLKEVRPGAVALYVPRGKGAFPSVTMMTSVPAVIAGVPQIAIVTPPTADGSVDAATLVAARFAGVETVYKCGGAHAVAAVAYG
ncbi:MAG: histidinol dehydrogenase, partial [Mesorhizobium sp.]